MTEDSKPGGPTWGQRWQVSSVHSLEEGGDTAVRVVTHCACSLAVATHSSPFKSNSLKPWAPQEPQEESVQLVTAPPSSLATVAGHMVARA